MNPNVSMNQFSLPGMEQYGHPGAPFLAKGVMYHHETREGPGEWPDEYTGEAPQRHLHSLYAHSMGAHFSPEEHIGNVLGEMHWAGSRDASGSDSTSGSNYPGEVTWISRGYGPVRQRGLMTSLFRMGHDVDFGQTTVPVHSPERTPEGEEWSAKVGPAHLRPAHGHMSWRPPPGTHPYERAGGPRQFQPQMEGQTHLFLHAPNSSGYVYHRP